MGGRIEGQGRFESPATTLLTRANKLTLLAKEQGLFTPCWLRILIQHIHVGAWIEVHFDRPQGGVTPIDSILTAATAGQNFDRLFSAV